MSFLSYSCRWWIFRTSTINHKSKPCVFYFPFLSACGSTTPLHQLFVCFEVGFSAAHTHTASPGFLSLRCPSSFSIKTSCGTLSSMNGSLWFWLSFQCKRSVSPSLCRASMTTPWNNGLNNGESCSDFMQRSALPPGLNVNHTVATSWPAWGWADADLSNSIGLCRWWQFPPNWRVWVCIAGFRRVSHTRKKAERVTQSPGRETPAAGLELIRLPRAAV